MEQELSEQLCFRVSPETANAVKKLAKKEERKLADVLRRLLIQALKEK